MQSNSGGAGGGSRAFTGFSQVYGIMGRIIGLPVDFRPRTRNLFSSSTSLKRGRRTLTEAETQLLERARRYDAQALAEIYDQYAGPIYGYLYRYLGDAHQAEDLTSEVFLRLLQALNTRRGPRERLLGWLYRVAHNLAMDWFRQQAKRTSMPLDTELVADEDPPPIQVEAMMDHELLRGAIRSLAPDQQQVILLRFGEGYKLAEVARFLGKTEGAVKSLQHRAVKRLRQLLEQDVR
jgi:RNA polymerase sigma-70 factor (ECF subfamily)